MAGQVTIFKNGGIILLLFLFILTSAGRMALAQDSWWKQQRMREEMAALMAKPHKNFWNLRVGGFGGVALNEHNPYMAVGDTRLMGRSGLQLAAGLYTIWPLGNQGGSGIGVLVSQELGGGFYTRGATANGVPFIGNTSLDVIYPLLFSENIYMEFVFGLGVAYSDGSAYSHRFNSDYKAPYIYNDSDIGPGAAFSIKFGLQFGGYLNDRFGLAGGFIYELYMDDFMVGGSGGPSRDLVDKEIKYLNNTHHFLPTLTVIYRAGM